MTLVPRNSQSMTTACGATVNRLSFRPADGGFLYTHQEAATIQYNIDNNANLTQTDKKLHKEAMIAKGLVPMQIHLIESTDKGSQRSR